MAHVEIFHRFELCIAHRLDLVPPEHKCSRLHGHNYKVIVRIQGETGPLGWITDYAVIRAEWDRRVHSKLDHRFLNEIPGLEISTSENLCVWIWDVLKPVFPGLSAIEAWEVSDAGSIFRGEF